MPTSALPRISVRADVGIGPYGRSPTNPDLCIFDKLRGPPKRAPFGLRW